MASAAKDFLRNWGKDAIRDEGKNIGTDFMGLLREENKDVIEDIFTDKESGSFILKELSGNLGKETMINAFETIGPKGMKDIFKDYSKDDLKAVFGNYTQDEIKNVFKGDSKGILKRMGKDAGGGLGTKIGKGFSKGVKGTIVTAVTLIFADNELGGGSPQSAEDCVSQCEARINEKDPTANCPKDNKDCPSYCSSSKGKGACTSKRRQSAEDKKCKTVNPVTQLECIADRLTGWEKYIVITISKFIKDVSDTALVIFSVLIGIILLYLLYLLYKVLYKAYEIIPRSRRGDENPLRGPSNRRTRSKDVKGI